MTAPTTTVLSVGSILLDLDGEKAHDIAVEMSRRAVAEVHKGDREMALMLLEDATTIADLAYPEGSLDALALESVIVAAAKEYEHHWPVTS